MVKSFINIASDHKAAGCGYNIYYLSIKLQLNEIVFYHARHRAITQVHWQVIYCISLWLTQHLHVQPRNHSNVTNADPWVWELGMRLP
jgi:hypothetical protein